MIGCLPEWLRGPPQERLINRSRGFKSPSTQTFTKNPKIVGSEPSKIKKNEKESDHEILLLLFINMVLRPLTKLN